MTPRADVRVAQLAVGAWSPDVHAALSALLDSAPAGSDVVFDWDDTVIAGDVGTTFLELHDRTHGTTWAPRYRQLLVDGGRRVAYPAPGRWLAGHTPESLAALTRKLTQLALAEARVRFRPEMVDLIAAAHDRGWRVWVVTASPGAVVRAMAVDNGIPPERVFGMDAELDADGRFTEALLEPLTMLEGKAEVVRQRIGERPLLVAGDSRSDAAMLDLATHALLVDGHDAELLAEARRKGWWVQSGWEHSPPEPGVVRSAP